MSPNGSVQKPCGVCGRNTAIDWLPWEASNSDWVHSRLSNTVGAGASETRKQACGSHPFLQSQRSTPPQGVVNKSAPQQCAVLSGLPRNPPAVCAPPPLPAYRWAICPCPQQHAHSLGSSCGPSWSLWGEESRQERRQQARGECLNTGTIWGSSLIFSLKLVRPPGL